MKKYFKLMRVHHYLKNCLLFIPLVCSGKLFDGKRLFAGALGFVAFSVLSSVVYIMNDINDKEKDARHPKKCKRPIASGSVSVRQAIILAVTLCIASAVCCYIGKFQLPAIMLIVLYFLLNVGYSFGLKNVPLLDIVILVSGFVIRVFFGAQITEITLSNWLLLTVTAISFYLALGKRRNELKKLDGSETREVLKYYPENFLDRNMYMCLALTNVFYALWSMDERTIMEYGGSQIVFTVPLVLIITMKYSLDIEGEADGDPIEVLLHDKILILLGILYVLLMFFFLYL